MMSRTNQIKSDNNHASSLTIHSIPPFAGLPDLCLLALLRQLPPADQMSARKTCHRWSVLVPVANRRHPCSLAFIFKYPHPWLYLAEDLLNHLSHGIDWKLLKLLHKEDGSPLVSIHPLTKWNSLQFSTLDEETVSQIAATFPVVRKLQLFANIQIKTEKELHCDCYLESSTSPLDLLIRLLKQWRHQLTTLNLLVKIWSCRFKEDFLLRPSIGRLSVAINSLSALKHLSTNLKPFFPNVRLLTQLTEFNTNSILSPSNNIMLRHYNLENSALTRISFGYYSLYCKDVASLSKDLRQRVVCLGNLHFDYQTICDHFRSLTSARFDLSSTTLHDFLTRASQLTELIYLYLYYHFLTIPPDDQPHRLPQLKSVKLLGLIFNSQQSHRDLEQLHLAWTMPNLQVIKFKIIHLECTTCGISKQSTPDRKKHCLRQIFAPLKRGCAHLHTIKHNHEESLGTAEELMAEAASLPIDTEVSQL